MSPPPVAKAQLMGSPIKAMATADPIKGAKEKYAPVRDAPIRRKETTNSTRLRPYPNSPSTQAPVASPMAGNGIPRDKARDMLTRPAASPLTAAMRTGSPNEIFRVKLLSSPQQRQAATTARALNLVPWTGPPSQAMTTAPKVKAAMPRTILVSRCSLKTDHAMPAVKTPSRVSSRDAVEAEMPTKPVMRSTGPSMPPVRIAPASQRQSPLPGKSLCRLNQ